MAVKLIRTIAAALLLGASVTAAAIDFPDNESLRYDVLFKWGMINQKAGSGTVSIRRNPSGGHRASIIASSVKWADGVFAVRDTLYSTIGSNGKPLVYEKMAHEGPEHKYDHCTFDYSKAGTVEGACIRRERMWGKTKPERRHTITSRRQALDIVNIFYFMRQLPYERMKPGHETVVDVFSGKCKEVLTISYVGREMLEHNGRKVPTHHIHFVFRPTEDVEKSDDMDAWIADDARRIPLKMEGLLPIGKIHCIYKEK